MISDERRVTAYRSAIEQSVLPGDVVVDVGTGTGLLSFLCLQAGASRVHAIDRSPVIEFAKQIAAANGFSDRIIFHSRDSRQTDIGEKADILISELIGHLAFEEGMVETLIDAAHRFLHTHGSMIPQKVPLKAASVFDPDTYVSSIDALTTISGIDYSVMRHRALDTTYVVEIDHRNILAEPQAVFSLDFPVKKRPEAKCTCRFTIHRASTVHGVAFWFEAALTKTVNLSSGPWAKTHWCQCFVPLPKPIHVNQADILPMTIRMRLRDRPEDSFQFQVDCNRGDN